MSLHPISRVTSAGSRTLMALVACLACADPTSPAAPTPPRAVPKDSISFIYRANPDGTDVGTLHAGSDPAWSPDGSRFVFVRDGSVFMDDPFEGEYEVAPGTEPAWSPDGRWITFTDASGIWILRPNRSEARRLVAHDYRLPGLGFVGNPAWSPDGSMIAFEDRGDEDFGSGPQIYVVPVDGSRAPRRLVAHGVSTGSERSPSWSPDGKSVLFASDGYGIALVNVADGSVTRRWKDWPQLLVDAEPAWTADGSAILFSYRESSGAPHVLMRLDTGATEPRLLVRDARQVAVSPDGRQIAFVRALPR